MCMSWESSCQSIACTGIFPAKEKSKRPSRYSIALKPAGARDNGEMIRCRNT